MAVIDLAGSVLAGSSSDPLYGNVVTLLHFDGQNNATTFVDNSPSPRTWTAVGAAKLSTAQKKFGNATLSLDGAGSWVETTGTSSFALGAGDFAIEFWINTTDSNFVPVDFYTTNQNTWQLWATTTGTLQFYAGNTGGNGAVVTSTTAINNGAWHHVRVSRSGGGATSIAIDGVVEASATDLRDYSFVTSKLAIGAQVSTRNATYDLNGYIADLRITKGAGRSGAVPTAYYPDAKLTATLTSTTPLSGAVQCQVDLQGDPLASAVKVLLYGDGTSGAITTVDSSPTPKPVVLAGGGAVAGQGAVAGALTTSIQLTGNISASVAATASLLAAAAGAALHGDVTCVVSLSGELLMPSFTGGPYMLVEPESLVALVPADGTRMTVS